MRVKVCGVTTVAQAEACADLGVDAIGVNLVPSSPRHVDEHVVAEIVRALRARLLVVAVVADRRPDDLRDLVRRTSVGCLQLHGDESADDVRALLPHAYKAVHIGGPDDVQTAESMPGEYLLVDSKVAGALGGTGRTVDWGLVAPLARARRLVLAGGLTPDNVRLAIDAVRPWCVDVASGVESAPGLKDLGKVRAFVAAARA